MQAWLCAGIHNRLKVVLDVSEQPHPLVLEIDKIVVAQMRQVGLNKTCRM